MDQKIQLKLLNPAMFGYSFAKACIGPQNRICRKFEKNAAQEKLPKVTVIEWLCRANFEIVIFGRNWHHRSPKREFRQENEPLKPLD